MRSKLILTMSLVLLMSVILNACSGTTSAATAPATQAPQVPAQDDWSKVKSVAEGDGLDTLIAAAKAEGELNVITLPRDWCNYGEMMDNFAKKYGIKVTSLNSDGGSADEIQAIIDK